MLTTASATCHDQACVSILCVFFLAIGLFVILFFCEGFTGDVGYKSLLNLFCLWLHFSGCATVCGCCIHWDLCGGDFRLDLLPAFSTVCFDALAVGASTARWTFDASTGVVSACFWSAKTLITTLRCVGQTRVLDTFAFHTTRPSSAANACTGVGLAATIATTLRC